MSTSMAYDRPRSKAEVLWNAADGLLHALRSGKEWKDKARALQAALDDTAVFANLDTLAVTPKGALHDRD